MWKKKASSVMTRKGRGAACKIYDRKNLPLFGLICSATEGKETLERVCLGKKGESLKGKEPGSYKAKKMIQK